MTRRQVLGPLDFVLIISSHSPVSKEGNSAFIAFMCYPILLQASCFQNLDTLESHGRCVSLRILL